MADEDGLTPLDVAKNKAVKLTLRQAWMSSSRKAVVDLEATHELSGADSKSERPSDVRCSIDNYHMIAFMCRSQLHVNIVVHLSLYFIMAYIDITSVIIVS